MLTSTESVLPVQLTSLLVLPQLSELPVYQDSINPLHNPTVLLVQSEPLFVLQLLLYKLVYQDIMPLQPEDLTLVVLLAQPQELISLPAITKTTLLLVFQDLAQSTEFVILAQLMLILVTDKSSLNVKINTT